MDEYIKKADVLEYLSARRNQVLKSPLSTLDAKFEVMEIFDFVDHRVESADVVPVRHGQWVESNNFDIGFWVCSNCNFVSEAIAAHKLYKYCPNCGCMMDLEG